MPMNISIPFHASFTHKNLLYTFFQKLVMISEIFFKEKLEVISFQKHVGFSSRQLFSFPLFFIFLSFVYFFFFIYVDIYSQRFFLFTMILVHFFIILDDVPKKWKILRDFGTSTNTIDNNEVNTNVTVQTTRMHKTKSLHLNH